MKKCRLLINICQVLFIVFLPLAILITILQYYSYNQDFYIKEFERYEASEVTGMIEEDLNRVSNRLISYIKDDAKDLNMQAIINGEPREVFGQREKQHMVDVKELFIRAHNLRSMAWILVLAALITILIASKRKKEDIYRGLLWSGIIPILLMLILYILINIDFHRYFTYFHKIFFTNDLWLLDPKREVLIQMLPLEFFMNISMRIIGWFLVILIGITSISFANLRRNK